MQAFQSTAFSVKEFQQGSERMQTYLQSLANKLNSGEKFNTNTILKPNFDPYPARR